jgi:hypothetical protein
MVIRVSSPVMLPTEMEGPAAVFERMLTAGLLSNTLLFVILALKGWLGPALYMSLPCIRSYMTPKPPRTTVLPESESE